MRPGYSFYIPCKAMACRKKMQSKKSFFLSRARAYVPVSGCDGVVGGRVHQAHIRGANERCCDWGRIHRKHFCSVDERCCDWGRIHQDW